MRCFALVPVLLVAATSLLAPEAALGAGQRSFASTVGVDNPNCSIAQPCRSFAAAISGTSPGGEVIVLDSGGYGPATIAKSLSIVAPPGVYAGISVTSGSGITIQTASPGDRVVLDGLAITNQGSAGNGIDFAGGGVLEVLRTRIAGFDGANGVGLRFAPAANGQGRLRAADVRVSASKSGIRIEGGASLSNVVNAVLERVDSAGNGEGLVGWDFSNIVAIDSSFTQNFPNGIAADTLFGAILLMACDRCNVSRNEHGMTSSGAGLSYIVFSGSTIANNAQAGLRPGAGTEARIGATTISQNTIGIDNGGGVVQSQGNNFVFGNASDGIAPIFVGSK